MGAAALFLAVHAASLHEAGLVGEILPGASPRAPVVVTELPPATAHDPGASGPLVARATRPMLALSPALGGWPLAINTYTGGLPDGPARLAWWLTGAPSSVRVAAALGGALLVLLACRFLSFTSGGVAALSVGLLLATDPVFHLYKALLGGTEVALQGASLLLIWGIWSRRWRGGVHGTAPIAAAVALGLHAKLPFVGLLAAAAASLWLLRHDRDGRNPPAPLHLPLLAAAPLVGLLPGLLAALAAARTAPPIPSHDFLGLQLHRLLSGLSSGLSGGGLPAREGLHNLAAFLQDPLSSLPPAWGGPPRPLLAPLRLLGWALTLGGLALEIPRPTPGPAPALLRWLALLTLLGLAAIPLLNRDLHHLALLTLALALLPALAAERLAAHFTPPRSLARLLLTLLVLSPHLLSNATILSRADDALRATTSASFSRPAQAALASMLRGAGVTRLVTSDYESYGLLEALTPEIAATHTWAAVARDRAPLAEILRLAAGGHYLVLQPSMPMIYTFAPSDAQVRDAASRAGLRATKVSEIAGKARLYAVTPAPGAPASD